MINELLTDYDRVCLTKKAYEGLNVGDDFVVNGKLIGRIVRDVYAQDGMQAYVIENQAGRRDEVTVLFKGSSGLRNGNATTWRDEWLNTNWPIFVAMLTSRPKLPSALKTASSYLNKWLVEFPDAIFTSMGILWAPSTPPMPWPTAATPPRSGPPTSMRGPISGDF